jgi:DNA-binding MarR family transcriptional regulator
MEQKKTGPLSGISQKPLRRVFLGDTLDQLSAVILEQGQKALREAGVELSPRVAPIVLLLAKRGPLTAADLAKALQQPHQLVAQRLDALVDLKIIIRVSDPADARRKLLKMTPKGRVQLARLKEMLDLIEAAYERMFDRIGCDLSAKVLEAAEELSREPLADRVRTERKAYTETG